MYMVLKISGVAVDRAVQEKEDRPVMKKELAWRDLVLGMVSGFLAVTVLIRLFNLLLSFL